MKVFTSAFLVVLFTLTGQAEPIDPSVPDAPAGRERQNPDHLNQRRVRPVKATPAENNEVGFLVKTFYGVDRGSIVRHGTIGGQSAMHLIHQPVSASLYVMKLGNAKTKAEADAMCKKPELTGQWRLPTLEDLRTITAIKSDRDEYRSYFSQVPVADPRNQEIPSFLIWSDFPIAGSGLETDPSVIGNFDGGFEIAPLSLQKAAGDTKQKFEEMNALSPEGLLAEKTKAELKAIDEYQEHLKATQKTEEPLRRVHDQMIEAQLRKYRVSPDSQAARNYRQQNRYLSLAEQRERLMNPQFSAERLTAAKAEKSHMLATLKKQLELVEPGIPVICVSGKPIPTVVDPSVVEPPVNILPEM